MKKLLLAITLVLCIALCLALASCGGEEETSNDKNANTQSSSTVNGDTSHTHTYGEWVETKAATCTEDGEKEQKCSCGDTVTETIAATGHTEKTVAAKEPTCTETGLTEGKKCSNCSEVFVSQEEVAATGHSYKNGACTACDDKKQSVGLEYRLEGEGYMVSGIGSCTDTEIVIPETYNDTPVIGIDDRAFEDCVDLISVVIFDNIKSIGWAAFYGCESIVIYCEIENAPEGWDSGWHRLNNAYDSYCTIVWNCKNNDVADDGYAYTIIDGIRYGIKDEEATVGKQSNNISEANISSVVIFNEQEYPVTKIGYGAFANCSNLKSVTIPDSVTYIGTNAFNRTGLTSIIIPDNVTIIEGYAFQDSYDIETVTLGKGVTSIGDYAFGGCSKITKIVIPISVNYMGKCVFSSCSELTIYCEAKKNPNDWNGKWYKYNDYKNLWCPVVWGYHEHQWIDATCTDPKTCQGCGETEGEALGHSYVEGICSVCGANDPDSGGNVGGDDTGNTGTDVKLDIVGSEITKEQWEEMRATDNYTVNGTSVDGQYENEYKVTSNAIYMRVADKVIYSEKIDNTYYTITYVEGMGMIGMAAQPYDYTIQGMLLSIEMSADTFDLMTFNSEKGCYVYEFKDAPIQGDITDATRSGIYEFYFVDGKIAAIVLVDDQNEAPQIVYITDVGTTGDVEIPAYTVMG